MNATVDLERRLAAWLEEDGPADVRAHAVEAALAQARTVRQRRAWLTRTWWGRQQLVAAPAPVEAGAIEPAERIPTFPVARPPLRQAWVIVLLAALLAALVGGTLLVGSQLQRRLPAVVPNLGPVFACPPGSTPDKPGPVDQARPFGLAGMAGMERMAFDRRAGRLVALASTLDGPVETWTFDVCTNTWTRMHPNQEPPPGTRGLVYDVDSDLTIASDSAGMWAYDLDADTWTEKSPIPPPAPAHPLLANLRFYDPVSGLVVDLGDDGDKDTIGLALWSYDVETDTWAPIRQAEPMAVGPHYEFFAYDASVDRLVAYARACPFCENVDIASPPSWARTWLFDLRTGAWSETSATPQPDFNAGLWGNWPAIAYDEAAERTVILGQGHSAAYDAGADRWERLYGGWTSGDQLFACGSRPECRQSHFMVYDPVNERLIVYGGFLRTAAEPEVRLDDMVALDTRTGQWTVLLEASEEQPAPTSE